MSLPSFDLVDCSRWKITFAAAGGSSWSDNLWHFFMLRVSKVKLWERLIYGQCAWQTGANECEIFGSRIAAIAPISDERPDFLIVWFVGDGRHDLIKIHVGSLASAHRFIGFFERFPLQRCNNSNSNSRDSGNQPIYRFEQRHNFTEAAIYPIQYGFGPFKHTRLFWVGYIIALIGGVLFLASFGGGGIIMFLANPESAKATRLASRGANPLDFVFGGLVCYRPGRRCAYFFPGAGAAGAAGVGAAEAGGLSVFGGSGGSVRSILAVLRKSATYAVCAFCTT
jgi:hypothetical protein